jgi:sugar phosphate isomerase/epimerase
MKTNQKISRRSFLTTTPGLIALPTLLHDLYRPKSKFKGVQIGAITYSFRDLPDQSADATIQYLLEAGLFATELMGGPAESFAGMPKNPVDMSQLWPLMRKRMEKQTLSDEEKIKLSQADATIKEYRSEVAAWRRTAPMHKFDEVGKKFKKAGISIYAFKPDAFSVNNSTEEIEYGMKAAKALGANQITLEHPSNDEHTAKLGKLAEKYKIYIGYHGHEQQHTTFWDKALQQSPMNALNLDLGHYIAAGNKDALPLIQAKKDRIVSMHIKDRQNPANGKSNLEWGKGDTPIGAALRLMRDQKMKFPATIELEYKIPEGSSSVKEVQKCLEFCKIELGK